MTLTLILTRHAKSDWGDPALDDHDRPLNERGLRDAPRIGRWLTENGLTPDLALCSSATRARQTLEEIAPDCPATIVSDLYMASPRVILRVLRDAPPVRLILVAHNPGIGAFAEEILANPPDHPRFHGYPTAATLVAEFDIDSWADHPRFHGYPTAATLVAEFDIDSWADLRPGTGRVRAFITPHDLPA